MTRRRTARIGVGGLMHESNTFAGSRTGFDEFRAGSYEVGAALLPVWEAAHHEVGGFLEGAHRFGFEAVPTAMAWATPSGPVEDAVLDEVTGRIVESCLREEVDGLLIALHGAMVTPGFPDADGEVLRRLREALGPDRPIVASLDYHGNVSPLMLEAADALVGYQTYPHIDQRECGLRAAVMMRGALDGVRLRSALVKPPMIVNLLGQETDREPLRSLMVEARAAERRDGVLSVSLMAGFPYADVPEMGPSVIVVTDDDESLAAGIAREFGDRMWELRDELDVRCPTVEEAIGEALGADRHPVVLVDLGDNVGGGTPGDGTLLLRELIRRGARDAVVVLHDPAGVAVARGAGVGNRFEGAVGGRTLPGLYGPPLEVAGIVRSLHAGTWIEELPRHGGRRLNDQGPSAVVELPGPILVVLNSLRTPPFSLGQLTSVGIDAAAQKILVAKAAVAHKAAYGPIAARFIPVDTPGLTAINPSRFDYRNIRRPMSPLDAVRAGPA